VNVLSGAPFGYWVRRKSERAAGAYKITGHEPVLVAEMFRREPVVCGPALIWG